MRLRGGIVAVGFMSLCIVAWIWFSNSAETASRDIDDLRYSESPSAPSSKSVVYAIAPPSHSGAEETAEETADAVPRHADTAAHDHLTMEDPTGDLMLYERLPMSAIPHHVVRGWGAHGAGDVPGIVGAYVIVAPGLTDEDLEKLARDIRAYHDDAEALAVRILDSEHAATYDRHSDAGELAAAHLVGMVNRNERLEMDRITIRGRTIESTASR